MTKVWLTEQPQLGAFTRTAGAVMHVSVPRFGRASRYASPPGRARQEGPQKRRPDAWTRGGALTAQERPPCSVRSVAFVRLGRVIAVRFFFLTVVRLFTFLLRWLWVAAATTIYVGQFVQP